MVNMLEMFIKILHVNHDVKHSQLTVEPGNIDVIFTSCTEYSLLNLGL